MNARLTDEDLIAIEDQCDGMGLLILNASAAGHVRSMIAEIRDHRIAGELASFRGISVTRVDSSASCKSGVEAHRDEPAAASLQVSIGTASVALCLDCARDAFNAIGFMIMSRTGESIQQLVGLKKRKGSRR